jgi:L-lactate dehydrogenase complex protein LldF
MAGHPVEEWRDAASALRAQVIQELPGYLDEFSANATKAGAVVHRARDAETAREIVFHILHDRRATKIVKAKSMVTEEIHLNQFLEARGMQVIETDLGEYIVQLAQEAPSHILAPAIHKNRRQIGLLFAEKLDVPYSEDPIELTRIAREALREEFLSAHAGVSGANLAVADTGSLAMFTNEGNGRMVTTLPDLHVAVLSIEKIIPRLVDLPAFIRLLPRSATGQVLSSYLSVITGTRKPHEATGAKELHIVLLDNGRTELSKGPYWEILKCIRCSACMNVCPVYRAVGGHAYGCVYPGPMGIVLTTVLEGMDKAYPLLDGSTLCGACSDVCPVRVPLTKLLMQLREERAEMGFGPALEKAAMTGFATAARSPMMFELGQRLLRTFWPVLKLVAPQSVMQRLPEPAKDRFSRRMG